MGRVHLTYLVYEDDGGEKILKAVLLDERMAKDFAAAWNSNYKPRRFFVKSGKTEEC